MLGLEAVRRGHMFRTRPCLAMLAGALATLVVASAGCGGDPAVPAGDAARRMPRSAFDATCDMNAPGFGAHLSHSGTAARGPISCLECHAPCAPAPAAAVAFGGLARADGATPLWSSTERSCTGVYCHGATGVTATPPVSWTFVDPDRPRPAEE